VMTGTLNIADLRVRLHDIEHTRTIITALAFLTVGICLKFALFPLHFWLPGAYTFAPSVVSVFLASTTTKVYIYVMLRFLYSVFSPASVFEVISLDLIFLICALLAIFSGSLTAIYQNDVKSMMAYSSIAQIGYMILGVSLVSVTGLLAGIIHLFNHALMKGALFMCLSCVYYHTGSVRLSDLRGIGWKMPWTMAAFVVAGLSLIGIPLSVGFISKWYLVLAAIERNWWWLAGAVIAGSLLAVIYIWRVVETAYFRGDDETKLPAEIQVTEAPLSMLIPLWVMIAANLYFGIDTSLTISLAEQAATYLFGTGL
jgi:multicomponent Na+:H+ antiporter subunit D